MRLAGLLILAGLLLAPAVVQAQSAGDDLPPPPELSQLKALKKQTTTDSSSVSAMPIDIRRDAMKPLDQADADFRFATAVAGFGQVLRGGRYTGGWTVADARKLAAGSVGSDRFGYRGEFLRLAGLAQALAK